METIKRIRTSDIPNRAQEQGKALVKPYSVGLMRGNDTNGSATFVRLGDHYGLLTAHHVLYGSKRRFNFGPSSSDKLGLCIQNTTHRFELQMRYLIPYEIGIPESDEFGPDLAFLEIPQSLPQLGTLKAICSFWNLTVKKKDRITDCYSDVNSLWAVTGAPVVWERTEGASYGFNQVLTRPALVGYTGVERRYDRNQYDYFEVAVAYRDIEDNKDLPISFVGLSGGGLWRLSMTIEKPSDSLDTLKIARPILSGVIFYQTPLESNRRILRCHGSRSIYHNVVESVLNANKK